MKKSRFALLFVFVILSSNFLGYAQEMIVSLPSNPAVKKNKQELKIYDAARPLSLTLPFFEDFTNAGNYPDPQYWQDNSVWINNTMTDTPLSRGIATFDALNANGIPYDTIDLLAQNYADSLTSQPIDLSGYQASDSIYFSFIYKAQGLGYSPKSNDSLLLFFLNTQLVWEQVWATDGGFGNTYFFKYLLPIKEERFLFEGFQFRFVNKATIGLTNSNWHVDYILIDRNRRWNDTAIYDIAFNRPASNLLSDFTSMPYRHFLNNPNQFQASLLKAYVQNNGNRSLPVTVGYTARLLNSGNVIGSHAGTPTTWPGDYMQEFNVPAFSLTGLAPANSRERLVVQTKYHCNDIYNLTPQHNDTIIQEQVFDNYFAYDDGSAEKAYFLSLRTNLPGTTAIEYALYQPDTIRGVAIQFAPQVPLPYMKEFALVIYQSIAVGGGEDKIVYEEDFLYPKYGDSIQEFVTYRLAKSIPLPAGTFYVGIKQLAGGLSDSLMIGIDMNRSGANHRYFNIESRWETSLLDGALLIRPIVGADLPTSIHPVVDNQAFQVYPNPAKNRLSIKSNNSYSSAPLAFSIIDIQGKILQSGHCNSQSGIDIAYLNVGTYFIRISNEDLKLSSIQKFVKE